MEKLLTVDEVAEILRKSPGAVRYMVHAGTAPRSARLAGRRMFREGDVRSWIDAQFAATDDKAIA